MGNVALFLSIGGLIKGATLQGKDLVETETFFLERGVSAGGNDEVIEQFYIQQLTGLHQLPGDVDILWGRRGIAAGVVMGHNHGRCRRFHGRPKNLANPHHARI